jgi:hypothetical protein
MKKEYSLGEEFIKEVLPQINTFEEFKTFIKARGSYKYKEISKKKFYEQFDIIHNQIKKIYETKKLPTNHYANDGKNSI